MSNRKDQSHWFIFIAILLIIVLVVALSTNSSQSHSKEEEEVNKRKEEEKRLVQELEALKRKKEIYTKHEAINSFTEKYMNELSEKRYRQLIQLLILLLVISNILIILLVPSMKFLDLFTWNGIAIGVLNLTAIFFFASVNKGKEYLKGIAKNYIEYRVFENRDNTYYVQKIEFYNTEIEKIKSEISTKNDQLNQIRRISENPNLNQFS
jgi:heme exporter protein D